MSTAPPNTLTEASKDSRTATGASCTADTNCTNSVSDRSSKTIASKTCDASSAVMVANASGLVARAVASSGLTTGGTTTAGIVVVVTCTGTCTTVEVVDVLVVVGASVDVVVVGTVDGGTVV